MSKQDPVDRFAATGEPSEPAMRCRHHWGRDPVVAASIAVVSGRRTMRVARHSFTNVHKTKQPPADADGRLAWSRPLSLVAGTGFEFALSKIPRYFQSSRNTSYQRRRRQVMIASECQRVTESAYRSHT